MARLTAILPAVALAMISSPAPADDSASERDRDPSRPSSPIALHPDNPRYFIWRGEPAVLVTSGEHYGALLNLDFDYRRYLETLEKDGLNHTRTFSGAYREIPSSFGITDNTLAPKPGRFICPWARSDTPGDFDGGNKFDLKRWDPEYFERLRDLMTVARDHGIVVELVLFCPMYNDELWKACPMNAANNVNGVGTCAREEVYTLKHAGLLDVQLALTRKLVSELREFDNLYFEVCNEPYFGGVTMEWQHRVIDTIVETEKDLEPPHLISLNIANDKAEVRDPHPAVSIFNFHYCVPPDTVALNWHLDKVIGENETGFRGKDDLLYRTEGWDFLLAGGAIYNNLDYSFTPGHPDGTLLDYSSPGGGSPALRRQLRILKDFLEGFEFVRMRPEQGVIAKVEPEGQNLSVRVLAERGKAYAAYVHVPLPKKPQDLAKHRRKDVQATLSLELPAGDFAVEWVDTKSGRVANAATLEHDGGIAELASPPFDDDIALRVVAARASPAESGVELSLLSWNILHGADADGHLNLDAKGRFLTEQDADVVLLQEVDRKCARSGSVDQIGELARVTGMHPAFGAFMPYQGGEYGMGALSGLPVQRSRSVKLPDGLEPRVALVLELEVLGETLLVVNVHFNWTRDDTARFAQACALLEELQKIDHAVIVAGDFNDRPESKSLERFYDAGFRHVDEPGPSFSAKNPRVDIDHILIRDGERLRLEKVAGGVAAESTLSDHRPVFGTVRAVATRAEAGEQVR